MRRNLRKRLAKAEIQLGVGNTEEESAALDEWLEHAHVIELDPEPGRLWLQGSVSAAKYYADALAEAREDARAELDELISS